MAAVTQAVTQYADLWVLHTRDEAKIEVQKDGAAVSVVYSELDENGAAKWSANVGSIPKAIPLLIRENRRAELMILDGAKVLFISRNGGRNWTAI